jgi:hypothetical protein
MNYKDASKLMEKMFKEERAVSNAKGKEYTQGQDRLDNFKRIAKEMGLDPKVVLYVYMKKHLDSITSFIKNNKTFSTEAIEGRIMDARVYLFLLRCIIEEERAEKKS